MVIMASGFHFRTSLGLKMVIQNFRPQTQLNSWVIYGPLAAQFWWKLHIFGTGRSSQAVENVKRVLDMKWVGHLYTFLITIQLHLWTMLWANLLCNHSTLRKATDSSPSIPFSFFPHARWQSRCALHFAKLVLLAHIDSDSDIPCKNPIYAQIRK